MFLSPDKCYKDCQYSLVADNLHIERLYSVNVTNKKMVTIFATILILFTLLIFLIFVPSVWLLTSSRSLP